MPPVTEKFGIRGLRRFITCDYIYIYMYTHTYIYIQGVSRFVDITAGGDFLGLCDQKSSYKLYIVYIYILYIYSKCA